MGGVWFGVNKFGLDIIGIIWSFGKSKVWGSWFCGFEKLGIELIVRRLLVWLVGRIRFWGFGGLFRFWIEFCIGCMSCWFRVSWLFIGCCIMLLVFMDIFVCFCWKGCWIFCIVRFICCWVRVLVKSVCWLFFCSDIFWINKFLFLFMFIICFFIFGSSREVGSIFIGTFAIYGIFCLLMNIICCMVLGVLEFIIWLFCIMFVVICCCLKDMFIVLFMFCWSVVMMGVMELIDWVVVVVVLVWINEAFDWIWFVGICETFVIFWVFEVIDARVWRADFNMFWLLALDRWFEVVVRDFFGCVELLLLLLGVMLVFCMVSWSKFVLVSVAFLFDCCFIKVWFEMRKKEIGFVNKFCIKNDSFNN